MKNLKCARSCLPAWRVQCLRIGEQCKQETDDQGQASHGGGSASGPAGQYSTYTSRVVARVPVAAQCDRTSCRWQAVSQLASASAPPAVDLSNRINADKEITLA